MVRNYDSTYSTYAEETAWTADDQYSECDIDFIPV